MENTYRSSTQNRTSQTYYPRRPASMQHPTSASQKGQTGNCGKECRTKNDRPCMQCCRPNQSIPDISKLLDIDPEKLLIILLIAVIMKDSSDAAVIAALAYLLI